MVPKLLSVLVPMLTFVFNCPAKAKDENDFNTRINKIVVRKPTGEQITNALEVSGLFPSLRQISFLKEYCNVGQYSLSFIEFLNTYSTLSDNPEKFSENEIATLTCGYDTSVLDSKIVTQIKFHRKVQEILCTNYLILRSLLDQIKNNIYYIFKYVYDMIKMLSEGRLPPSDWLWRLHINLNAVENSVNLELDRVFTKEYLKDINETLDNLVGRCLEQKYFTDYVGVILDKYRNDEKYLFITLLDFYKSNDGKYENVYKEMVNKDLHVNNDNLLLKNWWNNGDLLFKQIPGVIIEWGSTEMKYKKVMENVMNQYQTGEWIKDPFKHIEYYGIVLDIITIKLYCYIWVHLAVYQASAIDAQPSHFKFMQSLYDNLLKFAYYEDETLNDVLVLLSNINKPDDGTLYKVIDTLREGVKTILSQLNEQLNDQLTDMYYKFDDENQKVYRNYSKLLKKLSNTFDMEFQDIELKMNGMSLNTLLFFIKGYCHTVDIFFPNN